MNIKIATILTVHNRKQKTLSCLQHLYEALDAHNQFATNPIVLTVFLTDDGCTDGTADAIRLSFPTKGIQILQGSGSLFWAGGMRLAWQAAIDEGTPWDYYLLLNDDTLIYDNVFEELFAADNYGYQLTGRHGLVSGITCQPGNREKITYGGFLFIGKEKGIHELAQPTGKPQAVDMTHANILIVHKDTIQQCGIFYQGFQHSCADEDYSIMVHRKHLPVILTAHVCGECANDHESNKEEIERLIKMPLKVRKKFVNSPTHSDNDYLLFVRRNMPARFPFAWFMRKIRLYFPKLYFYITKLRGVYKNDHD